MNSTQTNTDLDAYNVSNPPATWDDITEDGRASIIICIVQVFSMILLLTLNPLCLLVLRRVDNIQDTTKVFLRSLTMADLGVGIFYSLPITVSALSGDWLFGDVLCMLQALLQPVCFGSSILSLFLLTIDRYISVVYALRYPSIVTETRARVAVCCAWGINLSLTIWNGFEARWFALYDSIALECDFANSNAHFLRIMVIYMCLLLSTMLAILATYIRLLMISRRHARRIHADNQVALGANQHARQNRKYLNTFLIMVVSGMLGNLLPSLFTIVLLLQHVELTQALFFSLVVMPIQTNSWLNVMIYYLRNKDIRQATRAVLISFSTFFKRVLLCRRN
ncbi:beta-1 adrenergic receptor-like [Patiria miniata]|uniref:G-protein coupled receptors family 1 profile domain-containing protein n=1 Tax=Patiria miniata TaxID=46514 RepID=A0A913Z162_PATMI|nr:beta-1 adrenergic receptor-like [Patiria miniata]